jgi:hypothetical protein
LKKSRGLGDEAGVVAVVDEDVSDEASCRAKGRPFPARTQDRRAAVS